MLDDAWQLTLRPVSSVLMCTPQASRCHRRMYILDLPMEAAREDGPGLALGGGRMESESLWTVSHSPRLYRISDEPQGGSRTGMSLEDAWTRRARDLGFTAGGMKLDSVLELEPVSAPAR